MAGRLRIATCTGTGLSVVKATLSTLGARVEVIESNRAAHEVRMDGLILLGGADIGPQYYGQRNLHCSGMDSARDAREWVLVRRALELGVPIMGICRGCQMIAAACGGSLWQDLAEQARIPHVGRHHGIYAEPLLRAHIPSERVNSLHHQAIKAVPRGFEVLAVSTDGVIEAIYAPGILGVQFHPELLIREEPKWGRLFRWFVAGLQPDRECRSLEPGFEGDFIPVREGDFVADDRYVSLFEEAV